MTPMEFGEALIRTEDLDPVYVGLVRAGLPRDQLHRWLLAYWMVYHMGVASWLSDCRDFWFWANEVAKNEFVAPGLPADRWPRGTERRHFRGQKAVQAVQVLSSAHLAPEHLVADLYRGASTAKEVMDRIQEWPMFGPWIAFKAADMIERCLGVPVQFPADLGLVYKEPREALDILTRENYGGDQDLTTEEHYGVLLDHFRQFPAPPAGDRFCGPAETETVLCKWKSYRGGHYWIGRDIHECRGHLAGWGETAERILAVMPQEVGREPV